MFFIRPRLSLEKPVGLTSLPHFPLSAGYITSSAYDESLPLRLTHLHNQMQPLTSGYPLYWLGDFRSVRGSYSVSLPALSSGHTIRGIDKANLTTTRPRYLSWVSCFLLLCVGLDVLLALAAKRTNNQHNILRLIGNKGTETALAWWIFILSLWSSAFCLPHAVIAADYGDVDFESSYKVDSDCRWQRSNMLRRCLEW
jgi:hypothetical protein